MVAVYDLLRGDAFFSGTECDGHTVFIAAADHDYVLAAHTQIAGINIGRNIYAGKMSDMHRPVGIGQGCGDEGSLEFSFH